MNPALVISHFKLYITEAVFCLLVPPTFTKKIENLSTVLGDPAVFHCSVEGSAPLYVQWQKDNVGIPVGSDIERTFQDKEAILRITACDAADSGKYTCHVVNEAGESTCFATLTVQGTSTSNAVILT